MGYTNLLTQLLRFLILRLVVRPIDFLLDTLQGYFSDNKPNKYLNGNYGPVYKECTSYSLPITRGSLPRDLAGEFVRNGPNPILIPKGGYHWFDGDGMLHGVRINSDGTANYINRQIKTTKLQEELNYGMTLQNRIGEMHGKLGLVKIVFSLIKQFTGIIGQIGFTANTALLFHNKKLQALVEADIPYEIKILNDGILETVGRLDYGGKIERMTAHPKVDPVTNELFFFSYQIMKTPYLTYGYADPSGNVVRTFEVPIPTPIMMHDFAITEHFVLFLDLDLVFNKKKVISGKTFSFDRTHSARVGILDRYAKKADSIIWIPVPANVVFHTANAWEEGDEVVLITCKVKGDFDTGLKDVPTLFCLVEWRFNLKTRSFKEELIVPHIMAEFPQIHPAYLGRKNKYVYTAASPTAFGKNASENFSGLMKVDVETKELIKLFTYGVNKYAAEGVFVPKEDGKSEDDGYLLTFVFDESTNSSSFWVIDAKSMTDIAIVDLPQRVPYGFHGIFVSENQIQSQLK